jgi:hypothetical protein
MESDIRVEAHGLKCDNPACDYWDESVPVSEYKNSIGKPCPKCGQSLLTQEDYDLFEQVNETVEVLNTFSEEEQRNIVMSYLEQGELGDDTLDALAALDKAQKQAVATGKGEVRVDVSVVDGKLKFKFDK